MRLSDDQIHLAAQLLDSLIALSFPNPHKRHRASSQGLVTRPRHKASAQGLVTRPRHKASSQGGVNDLPRELQPSLLQPSLLQPSLLQPSSLQLSPNHLMRGRHIETPPLYRARCADSFQVRASPPRFVGLANRVRLRAHQDPLVAARGWS